MRLTRAFATFSACVSAALLMGAANGAWLQRVSEKDHARTNPLVTTPQEQANAAKAGAEVYYVECAKCHGNNGAGLHSRPPVISGRIADASDGDLFWLMSNGVPWRGMPGWTELPAAERWQLVAYLRSINPSEAADAASPHTTHSLHPHRPHRPLAISLALFLTPLASPPLFFSSPRSTPHLHFSHSFSSVARGFESRPSPYRLSIDPLANVALLGPC